VLLLWHGALSALVAAALSARSLLLPAGTPVPDGAGLYADGGALGWLDEGFRGWLVHPAVGYLLLAIAAAALLHHHLFASHAAADACRLAAALRHRLCAPAVAPSKYADYAARHAAHAAGAGADAVLQRADQVCS
jgi:hypothetical protein